MAMIDEECRGVIVIIIILGLGIFMREASFLLAYFAYDSASEIKDYNSSVIKNPIFALYDWNWCLFN